MLSGLVPKRVVSGMNWDTKGVLRMRFRAQSLLLTIPPLNNKLSIKKLAYQIKYRTVKKLNN